LQAIKVRQEPKTYFFMSLEDFKKKQERAQKLAGVKPNLTPPPVPPRVGALAGVNPHPTPPPKNELTETCEQLILKHTGIEYQQQGNPWGSYTLTQEQAAEQLAVRPPAVIRIGRNEATGKGYRVATAGDLSMIVGAAKSRKTTFAAKMCHELLQPESAETFSSDYEGLKIVFFDTEQGNYHAAQTYSKITEGLTPEQVARLTYIRLRSEDNASRLRVIASCILELKPTLAVIDGVADLMQDTNSNTEAPQIVGLVMALAEQSGAHIVSVLHNSAANRSKGRGHVGSEFERKCESVLFVEKVKESTNTSEISPMVTRNAPFPKLYATHNPDGSCTLSMDYEPPTADDDTMNAAMMEAAVELHPQKTEFTFDELKQAHALARKRLGGGDPLSKSALANELKRFVSEGLLTDKAGPRTGRAGAPPKVYCLPKYDSDTETDGQAVKDSTSTRDNENGSV